MYTYFAKREKRFGMNFGLERMNDLLEHLNVSHENLPFVHIAGTNGKGSTLNYLKNIMMEQGYKVGTFTSPHIETISERIMINDEYIEEDNSYFVIFCYEGDNIGHYTLVYFAEYEMMGIVYSNY